MLTKQRCQHSPAVGLNSSALPRHFPVMVKITLDDDEARALRALLVDRTNLPTRYRHSPTQAAYRSILMKLDRAGAGG